MNASPRDLIEASMTPTPVTAMGRDELITRYEALLKTNRQLSENLTHVQARCTELLLEARSMAKVPAVLADALRALVMERSRQNEKWHRTHGEWPVSELVKLAVLGEEVGEVSRAILEGDEKNLREELVQVGAVCLAWLEVLP